jgi:ABC-type multidrug transport system ATPase subunit
MIAFKKRRAGALSGGMKQKLALSTILLSAPQFIILDEPTTGVDPLSRIEFFNIIKELKEEGKTIIISTPYLDEAEKGDHIIFLKSGKIIKKDTIINLKAEFPEKIFRILPKGNVYEILQELHQKPSLRDRIFIKGKYLRCIQKQEEFTLPSIPHISVEEEKPTLEDIYLYYERIQEEKSDNTHV